ncbi:MAG: ATP-binding protein [Thermodesulfobacteriota bacterium]
MQRPGGGTTLARKVLVVTGETSPAARVTELLGELGHEVVGVVAYGEEPLRFVRDRACDLVVIDPPPDGPTDPVEVVASFTTHVRLPIVFLTADCAEETLSRILDSGPVSLAVKPVTRLQLCAALEVAVRRALAPEAALPAADYARAVSEAAPDSVFVRDEALRFLYTNPAGERLFGIPRREIVGKTCADLLPADLAARIAASDRRVLAGEEVVEEFLLQVRGHEEVLHVARFPIRGSCGETVGIGAICRSLAQRTCGQDALLHATRREAVLEMTSELAFRFNNVLQVILGRSQLAAAQMEFGSFSGARKNLEHIQGSCREASDLVMRLQRFSATDPDDLSEPAGIVDLSAVVSQVLQRKSDRFRTGSARSGIRLRLGLGQGSFVHGRENDLAEVASHLVTNAAEALPHGGEVTVRTLREEESVLLQVRDNGVGIREEDMPKVFEPFWTTKHGGAAGMGLALARAVVERHGGEIRVESREGRGSCFTARFPFAEHPSARPAAPEVGHDSAPGRRILLVDDVEPVLTTLEDSLRFQGQEVLTASSGEEAIMVFDDYDVDVVVCDLRMPGLDGWDVAEHVLKSCAGQGNPKTPFILLTACTEAVEDTNILSEHGIDAVIWKPVQVSRLLEVISEVMNSDRRFEVTQA